MSASNDRRLAAARGVFEHLGELLDMALSVRLWDGSLVPLGRAPDATLQIVFSGPAVLGSLLRRPTLANLLLHYATGGIDVEGGDLLDVAERARATRGRFRDLRKAWLIRRGLPLLLSRSARGSVGHAAELRGRGRVGHAAELRGRKPGSARALVQSHYDLGNDFYSLFLDPQMQYSCAYFTNPANSLEQAQTDKLEFICRKLRLKAGDRLLDVGSGWGGLVCHAAQNYDVSAHGVTLSEAQYEYSLAKIRDLELEGRVSVELGDYASVSGRWDKIASVGMYEHVGLKNLPAYFSKLRSLLAEGGILLNHGITRRAKTSARRFRRLTPERRMILEYVFPGAELDHIGHTLEVMEASGFEIRDVEGWRTHYERTTRSWARRLYANRGAAIRAVGEERFRLWLAYLTGVSFSFANGSLQVHQVVATRRGGAPTDLPPTRADLYAG